MISPELISIMAAINTGDKARARQLLQPLLKTRPTAELWYQASRLTEKPEHELACLKQALGLDPYHGDARRRFHELQAQVTPPAPAVADAPAATPPKAPAPKKTQPAPAIVPADVPLKKARQRRKRGTWFYVGIVGSVLLSLTASYFVLLVLGSPLPGRLRSLLGDAPPVTELNGVPLEQVHDAVFKVVPSRTSTVTQTEPLADVLEPGVVHEYTFNARSGEELAIGVQFFSPAAQRVSRNLAILDPQGRDAESQCMRDHILQGDNGAVIICQIDRSGTWKLRLLGRENESSGAYVVSIGRLYD